MKTLVLLSVAILFITILAYFIISPTISYSNTPSILDNKIILKASCNLPIYKCKNKSDKILLEINKSNIITETNKVTLEFTKDISFNITSSENKDLVNELLQKLNINSTLENITFLENKIIVKTGIQTVIDCNITSSIYNSPCDVSNERIVGFYNIIKPINNGKSCDNFITNTMTESQKVGYTGWNYDNVSEKIVGYKDCCPSDKIYYNGNCISKEQCPGSSFKSQSGKMCLDQCPEYYYGNINDGKCTKYSQSTLEKYKNTILSLNNNDLACNKIYFNNTNDDIVREYKNEDFECSTEIVDNNNTQIYCNSTGLCNKKYNFNISSKLSNYLNILNVSDSGKELYYNNNYYNDISNSFLGSIINKHDGNIIKYVIGNNVQLPKILNYYYYQDNLYLLCYYHFSKYSNRTYTDYYIYNVLKFDTSTGFFTIISNNISNDIGVYSGVNMISCRSNNISCVIKNKLYTSLDSSSYLNITSRITTNENEKINYILLVPGSNYCFVVSSISQDGTIPNVDMFVYVSNDNCTTFSRSYNTTFNNMWNIDDIIIKSSNDGKNIYIYLYNTTKYFFSNDYGTTFLEKNFNDSYTVLTTTIDNFHKIYNIDLSNDGKIVSIVTSNSSMVTAYNKIIYIYNSNDYGNTFNESLKINSGLIGGLIYYSSSFSNFKVSSNGKYQILSLIDKQKMSFNIYSDTYGQSWVIKKYFEKNSIEDNTYNTFMNIYNKTNYYEQGWDSYYSNFI